MMIAAHASGDEASAEAAIEEKTEREHIIVTGRALGVLQLSQEADTSSRLGMTIMETPASVDVVSQDMIRSLGDRTVQAAVGRAAGMVNVSSAFGYQLVSRGFTHCCSPSVMQLYDGMRVYAGVQTFPVDPWMAERIEVLRGAASVLYGDGGIGGAINVVRKQPNEDRHEGEIWLGGGSFNTYQAAGGAGGPIGGGLSYRLDVSYNQSDSWMERGDSRSLAISGALRYRFSDDLSLTLTHDRADLEPTHWAGTPLRDGRLVPAIIEKNYGVLDDRLEFNDEWTQAKLDWSPSEQLTISNVAYYVTGLKFSKDSLNYQWSGEQIRRASFLDSIFDNEQFGNRLNAVYRHTLYGLNHRFSLGGEYNRATYRRSDNSPNSSVDFLDPYYPEVGYLLEGPTGLRLSYQNDVDQYALFGESRLELGEQLSLVTGLRYDRPEVERSDALNAANNIAASYPSTSWRAGVVYDLSENIALYAQYSTAADPITNLLSVSLRDVSYEMATGKQWEAGAKLKFLDGRGELSVSGYRIVKNKILTQSADDPTLSVQVGEQSSQGIEASFSLALTNTLSVLANGTILDAQYDDFLELIGGAPISRNGKTPTAVPETAANLWLSWTPLLPVRLDSGLRYVGERYSDAANMQRLPSYYVVDASARYQLSEASSVMVNARNLLDKLYAQAPYGNQWIIGEPRSVSVTLQHRF